MRAVTCEGRNLINHCKQTKKLEGLSIDYYPIKKYQSLYPGANLDTRWGKVHDSWVCVIKYRNNEFALCHRNKKMAFKECAIKATPQIKVDLGVLN